MSAALQGGLYAALMLKKLHEARPFARVLDAGAEPLRPLLNDALPGAVWRGPEVWRPDLARLRLVVRHDRVICPDLRQAGPPEATDLVLFGGGFGALPETAVAELVTHALARAPLVLVMTHAPSAAPEIRARLSHDGVCVGFCSTDPERRRQLARLQGVVPGLVRRALPDAALTWSAPEEAAPPS